MKYWLVSLSQTLTSAFNPVSNVIVFADTAEDASDYALDDWDKENGVQVLNVTEHERLNRCGGYSTG